MKLIFDKSVPGRRAIRPPEKDVPATANLDEALLRDEPAELPELSELDVVRHFTDLSTKNFGVDSGFYPLGSCTMKYNPKAAEAVAADRRFAELHPMLPQLPGGEDRTQGALQVIGETDRMLAEICGMARFTSQPMAGANGELTGVLLIAAYHRKKGNERTTILVPDSAHGTNPASAAIAGFEVQTVPSDETGVMSLSALEEMIDENTAGLMLTCPNTLGLFNPHVREICEKIHEVDGLCYYDGANLNALLGRVRPGDLGFDIVHVNLHKTFATPHGGGGPGAGPVGVAEKLVDLLPAPLVVPADDGTWTLDYNRPESIGSIAQYYGSFGIILRAYAYIRMLGLEGLMNVSANAVLNANYVKEKLKPYYDLPYDRPCMHECVLSASRQAANDIHAVDIAKALIDKRIHPMTVYFPLIVEESMMIEPTETEGLETIDAFIEAMIDIARRAEEDPESVQRCPTTTPVGRLDQTLAARKPDLATVC